MTTGADQTIAAAGDAGKLAIRADKDKSNNRALADSVMDGVTGNAVTAHQFASRGMSNPLTLTDCAESLNDIAVAIKQGNSAPVEKMLAAQAIALDVVFGELARRAAAHMEHHLQATEVLLRMALRAQEQSRKTVETLAVIRNPPVVFAKQANIAHGPQQVNIGMPTSTAGLARAAAAPTAQNGLLEAHDDERMDTGAASTAGRADPQLAPVGAIDRSHDTGRQGARGAQRLQGRSPGASAGADARTTEGDRSVS